MGSSSDQTGALVEATVSDRVLEFAEVSGIDGFLEISFRIAFPRPRVVPTGLPSRLVDDIAIYSSQQTPNTVVEPTSTKPGRDLHPRIADAVQRHLEAGLQPEAVLAAYGVVRDLVRELSGLHTLDGQDLYGKALGPDDPKVVLADLSSKTGRDYQRGVMLLCQGVAATIRNPLTHAKHDLTAEEAAEMLATMSLIYRKISSPRPGSQQKTT